MTDYSGRSSTDQIRSSVETTDDNRGSRHRGSDLPFVSFLSDLTTPYASQSRTSTTVVRGREDPGLTLDYLSLRDSFWCGGIVTSSRLKDSTPSNKEPRTETENGWFNQLKRLRTKGVEILLLFQIVPSTHVLVPCL